MMSEHVMLVPNTTANPSVAKIHRSKGRVVATAAVLSLCVGGAMFALGFASSTAPYAIEKTMEFSSPVPVSGMNMESNGGPPPQDIDTVVLSGGVFRLRLAGRSNLCVDSNEATISLAPCDAKDTSQLFKYDKKTQILSMAGNSNKCLGIDTDKHFKPELCSPSSASQAMVYDVALDDFRLRTQANGCIDNVVGETAGLPRSFKATVCDQKKRSQQFDILPATGNSGQPIPPLEKYPEMAGVFKIALIGADNQCLSRSGGAIPCTSEDKSLRFAFDADDQQFFAFVSDSPTVTDDVCVTSVTKAATAVIKKCADSGNSNQVFVYDYGAAMFRGASDKYNLCFPEAKRNGLTMLRWCNNDKKLY